MNQPMDLSARNGQPPAVSSRCCEEGPRCSSKLCLPDWPSKYPAQAARKTVDANDLEAMAMRRPDDMFLKGSGVLKLIAAIRLLEGQIRDIQAHRSEPSQDEREAFETKLLVLIDAGIQSAFREAEYEISAMDLFDEVVDTIRADGIMTRAALSILPMEGDANRFRQWFDHIQDASGDWLGKEDYELAKRLYEQCGMRVPTSITSGAIAAMGKERTCEN